LHGASLLLGGGVSAVLSRFHPFPSASALPGVGAAVVGRTVPGSGVIVVLEPIL